MVSWLWRELIIDVSIICMVCCMYEVSPAATCCSIWSVFTVWSSRAVNWAWTWGWPNQVEKESMIWLMPGRRSVGVPVGVDGEGVLDDGEGVADDEGLRVGEVEGVEADGVGEDVGDGELVAEADGDGVEDADGVDEGLGVEGAGVGDTGGVGDGVAVVLGSRGAPGAAGRMFAPGGVTFVTLASTVPRLDRDTAVGNPGRTEGRTLGKVVGSPEGRTLGRLVGSPDGNTLGKLVGSPEGRTVGRLVGTPVGSPLGRLVGNPVGMLTVGVADEGAALGVRVGIAVGSVIGMSGVIPYTSRR